MIKGPALLVVGIVFVAAGLNAFLPDDVRRHGVHTLHVDDADGMTLSAYPWVHLTQGQLLRSHDEKVCKEDVCHHLVPLVSAQMATDCARGDASLCKDFKLLLWMNDAQWKKHQDSQFLDVTGTTMDLPDAHGANVIDLDAQPAEAMQSGPLTLGGVILTVAGACMTVWQLQRRKHGGMKR